MGSPAEKVHEVLQSASAGVPRYLFRVFHSTSGNDASLNTTTAITPLAFKDGEAPGSIADVPKQQLLSILRGHLHTDESIKTFFSSWSGSLSFSFQISTLSKTGTPITNLHVAIVDTQRLGPRNLTFWAGAPSFQELDVGTLPNEYLIYGIVSGPCYTAAPLDAPAAAASSSNATIGIKWQLPSSVDACIEFGKRFGRAFEMVVTVHLLCRQRDISKDEALLERLLRELETPQDVGRYPNLHGHIQRSVDRQQEIDRCNLALAALGEKMSARASAAQ